MALRCHSILGGVCDAYRHEKIREAKSAGLPLEVAQGRLARRVEHVVSGQATHFASREELLTFIGQVLTAPPIASTKCDGGSAPLG